MIVPALEIATHIQSRLIIFYANASKLFKTGKLDRYSSVDGKNHKLMI